MDVSDLLTQCHTFTAEQSSIEQVPMNQAALYTFYDLLRFDHTRLPDELDRFITKHGRHVELSDSAMPKELGIKLRGKPARFRGEGLRLWEQLKLADGPSLTRSLLLLSLVGEPLYVGKTGDLRQRFRAHHDSGFLYRMKADFERSPDEFLLFAFYTATEAHARLLESILIQVFNPPFCDQKC
jgi:hypothetical protein